MIRRGIIELAEAFAGLAARSIALSAFVLAPACATAANSLPPAQVWPTINPTDDLVAAQINVRNSPFNAHGDGQHDDSTALQSAIDRAAINGGGVIFVPAGVYRLNAPLRLKKAVSIRGDWRNPDSTLRGSQTVLAIYPGRGSENGTPFLTMEKVSCIRGVVFWYPEQTVDHIVPYPWTIGVTDPSSAGYTVQDVTLVNSYKGLENGARDGQAYNVAYYRNIYGCPLHDGIWIEYVLDITRIGQVHFKPEYWENSGFAGAPRSAGARSMLRRALLESATAITIRRYDWCPLYSIEISGYRTGIHLANKPDIQPQNANGEIYDAHVSGCRVGLQIDGAQYPSWMVVNSRFQSAGAGNAAVLVKSGVENAIQFHACAIDNLLVEAGCRGAVSLESCTVGVADVKGGAFFAANTTFSGGPASLTLAPVVRQAALAGCTGSGARLFVAPPPALQPQVLRGPPLARSAGRPFDFEHTPGPHSRRIADPRAFGARADGLADDSRAIQAALDSVRTGGTVYLPAGRYLLASPIVVPSGVELRGVCEGFPHTMAPGSCLIADASGTEAGQPLIRLEPHSGIRGVTVWYRNQSLARPLQNPWSIQAAGVGCWVREVSVANSWQAIDFASASDTSGHYIARIGGAPLRMGLVVANSASGGRVEAVQWVVHFWSRNDGGLPGPAPPSDAAGAELMSRTLEAFRFDHCRSERIEGTFVYGTRIGLQLGEGFGGEVHLHGSDSAEVGVKLSGSANAVLVALNVAPFQGADPCGVLADESFNGSVEILAGSAWGNGRGAAFRSHGPGLLRAAQFNAFIAPGVPGPGGLVTGLYYNGLFAPTLPAAGGTAQR